MAEKKTKDELLQYLIGEAAQVLEERGEARRVGAGDRILQDLGMDSLDYATIMLGCEEWSGVKVSERSINWAEVQTLDDLAALFAAEQPANQAG